MVVVGEVEVMALARPAIGCWTTWSEGVHRRAFFEQGMRERTFFIKRHKNENSARAIGEEMGRPPYFCVFESE